MRLSFVWVLFLSCAALVGQDKDKEIPGIRFSTEQTRKASPVQPKTVSDNFKMYKDELFVVDSDVECFFRTSPKAVPLSITPQDGPIQIHAQFVGGTKIGYSEVRNFKGKYVYVIKSGGKDGKVDLFVTPKGVQKDQDILTKTFDVMNGGPTPTPPPKPKPVPPTPTPPTPDPTPPTPPTPVVVTSFHVVMVYESGATYTKEQTGVLYSKEISDYLTQKATPDNGTFGWRRRDKDTPADNDTAFQKSLWDAVKPKITTVPCYVVEVNGKADIIPLPASVAEGLTTLKKYAEGK